jgi:hypothetical protein
VQTTTQQLETRTAYATATLNTDADVPPHAIGGIFYWNISAVAGTTPIADCKIQAKDTISGQFVDIDGATFAQQTAASAQFLQVWPGLTADATGNARAVSAILGNQIRFVFTFDRTTANETYTFTLSADWLG